MMFEKASIILIFIVRCLLLENSSAAIYHYNIEIEPLYVNNFIDKSPLKNLCHLPKEKKLAICYKVLNDVDSKVLNDIDSHEDDDWATIYLNKPAAYYESMDCVRNKLEFTAPGYIRRYTENIMQDMFPCYGRNEPMRTNWNVDENYDRLYVSVGPERNSVFVYKHIKTIYGDTYKLYLLITKFNFLTLPKLKITWDDVRKELNSLNELTYNEDSYFLEVHYIREVVMKETHGNDPVCDLEKEHKISLCVYIFGEIASRTSYVFKAELFDDRSLACEEKHIEFIHNSLYDGAPQKMYPCYGFVRLDSYADNAEPQFYLSGGDRPNSVLIYEQDPVRDGFLKLYSFVENVRVSYMPYIEQVNEPLDEPEERKEKWYFALLQKLKDYFGIY